MNRGTLFVISAPSGCGKTTLLRKIMASLSNLVFSISHTTRLPRAGEQQGRDYYFVQPEAFAAIRDRTPSGFLEWAQVHGNFYGTSKEEVEKSLVRGLDVILDIDVQGARQLKNIPGAVFVFIAPPSMAELEKRLRGRGSESEDSLALRLQNARQELMAADEYDYLVINDQFDDAIRTLSAVIIAERSRNRRTSAGLPLRFDVS
jgi:guanylate kinase